MPTPPPRNPDFAARTRADFTRQQVMQTMGITITALAAGKITLNLPFNTDFAQQHGFMHAGVISTALDSACGYAAFTLMEPQAEVLTVEFKTSFLAPAQGDRFECRAEVLKSGRTLMVSEARAYAISNNREKLVAAMSATLMAVYPRETGR